MKFLLAATLLAVAAADSAPGYNAPAPAHHQPSYDTPPKYDYSYDVHGYGDFAPQFSAQEGRDGYNTKGSYTVALPDSRTQTVTYYVTDAYSGTIADVQYQGEAQYPAFNRQPSYKVASAYKAAPAYKAVSAYKPASAHKPAPIYKSALVHKPALAYKPASTYKPAPAQKAAY